MEKKKTPKLKPAKKKQAITPEVCAAVMMENLSNRAGFIVVGATIPENELKDTKLSVSSLRSKRLKFANEASEKIILNKLSIPSEQYTLHWDGKIFKSLTNCGKSEERIAVILTTSGGEEILLGIVPVANGTAAKEHEAILNLLHERKISLDKISACVFDTTSVNTGEVNGIVRKLERTFEHPILELACRHHMYELVCGAASEIIIGKPQQEKGKKKTTAPYEPLFKRLCESWKDIDKENFTIFDLKTLPRILLRHIDEAKKFLKKWLSNENSTREDYLQMAKLCLIYIGGDLPENMSKFKMQEPGAYHHARWMSKVLYVLKLAMLQPPFVNNIQNIRSLALFYSVYYAKAWLTCIFPAEAPSQDLSLFKKLEEVYNTKGQWPNEFKRITVAAMMKLNGHTWYLSERLVVLALFSENTDIFTKEKM